MELCGYVPTLRLIGEKISAEDRCRKKAFHMNSEAGWLRIPSLAIAWPAFNPDPALVSYVASGKLLLLR